MKKLMTIFLIMLFASLVYADNCSLTLSLNGNNDIYASNVYDDDGSIQFVDVFITDVEVTQYSFEAVSQGLILVESVPLGSEMSFSYSDSDGSMACIGIFGNIKEKGDRVSKPTLLYGAEFTPRLAEDNLSIYLDLAVDVNADHDFETVNLEYGYASGSYALSQALYQDGAQYKTTIGPFDKKVSIYSKVFGSGGGFDQTLYLKEHHFEVVTTDEDVCAEVVSLEGKESGANEQVQKEQEETNPKLARFADIDSQLTLTYFPDEELIRATTVVDDDSSIELVLIHIIDGESDSSYEYHGIVQGQSFDIVIPESATAYYNFSDYDGTMNGWGLFQPINNDTPVIPPEDPVDLIDSATIVAVPNSGYTSFELEITMHPESEADIAEAYLRYGFSENDYSEEMILDYDSESGNYTGTLGPFYNEFTLYSRTVAKDSEEKFDSLDLGVRWYKLVSPDQIECIDILDEEDYAIKPELFIRDAGVPAFVLFGDDIKINPVVKNSGVEEAGPFFVSLYIKDIQIDTKVINGLAVGQQEAVEFSIPSDDYFGVYVAKIVADAYKDIDELNENNNEEQVSFLVGYNIFNVIMNYNNTDLVVDERQMLILDRLGKAVEEASVTIQTPRGQIMTLTTDDSGVIEFLLDSPGDYTVQVSKENFETFNGSFAVPPLNIQFKKTVSSGSIQEIQVLGADGTPVTDAVIKIIGPDGREELYYTDDRGIVSFRASSTGTYDFEIIRKNVILLLGSFISAGIVEVTMSFGSQGMEAIVGQEILSHPELLLMLLAMCFVAALIAYTKSKMLFKKGVKSTRQKKIEHYLRLALAAAFFFLPLQVGKFFGFAGAVAFVLFEIMLFIVLDYYHQNVAKRRKAIKV